MDNMDITSTPVPEPTDALPPPYAPPAENVFGDEDDEDDESSQPTSHITINAPTSIHGSHNVVSMPPMDASRLAAVLVSTMNQKNLENSLEGSRQTSFTIQFNFGITIVGDRNIIGNVGVRPRLPTGAGPSSQAAGASTDVVNVGGKSLQTAKRRASEDPEDSPEPKRQETDTIAGSAPSPLP